MANVDGWPAGTLKYINAQGEEVIASPRDVMYSTVTMVATHYWNGQTWEPILSDADDF